MPHMVPFKRASNDDPGQTKERAERETFIIKELIRRYFETIKKSMNDIVPKTIMNFLVNKSKNQAQRVLVQKIYNDGQNLD
mmetsp:Transcript_1970/g.3460  ORF Transcript_1970/g.3460 Transcript_1970/m.3460 type:complete len:81 (+) Transcript_1970:1783-2025(+)